MTLDVNYMSVHGVVPKGSNIEDITVIAGKGVRNGIRDIKRLQASYPDYDPDFWQKKVGVVQGESFDYDVHWYANQDYSPEDEYKLKEARSK